MPYLPLLLQPDQRIERLQKRHRRRLPHIPEMDDIERLAPQLAQVGLAPLAQLLRATERPPALVGETPPPELRRDDEVLRVRIERLGDEPVRDVRAIEPRRVDEVHPERDDAAEDLFRAR